MITRKFLSCLVALAACVASHGQTDPAAAINQGIAAAIAAGRDHYTIPAGTYALQSKIVIPAGTKNFALRGAGSGATKFVTPEWVGHPITIGQEVLLHNNWGLTNRDNRNLKPAQERATSVSLADGSNPIKPGWYVIYGDNLIVHRTATSVGIRYAAEIVQVVHFDETRNLAVLDVPLGRSYLENPRLANVDAQICQNITVSGIAMDGYVASAGKGMAGLVNIGLTNGVTLDDLKIHNYSSGALQINLCRNVQVTRADIANASELGPGGGYGVYVMRSRFVYVKDSVARTSRHGFIFHSGTMDALVEDCEGYSTGGADFDTHGMDEQRITFRRCKGTSGWGVGNDAWVLGGKGHVIEDCNLGTGFVGPNVASLLVRRTTTGADDGTIKMGFWSNAGGMPGEIRFEDCTFRGAGRLLGWFGDRKFRRITFVRSQFLADWKSIEINAATGILQFLGCYFESRRPNDGIFAVWNSTTKDNLVIRDSTFVQKENGQFALWFYVPYRGRATVTNNKLISPTARTFYSGTAKGIFNNNTVATP